MTDPLSNCCVTCKLDTVPLTPLVVDKTTIKICSLDCLHIFMTATAYGHIPKAKLKGVRRYDKVEDRAV